MEIVKEETQKNTLDEITGKSFIGISKHNESYKITTPYGFVLPQTLNTNEAETKLLMKKYAKCISKALNSGNRKKESIGVDNQNKYNPISALSIVVDYIQNGLYKEIETEYKTDTTGKINFNKTIKTELPFCIDDEAYYSKYKINKKKINSQKLVSVAQGNVINHFITHGGEVLFGNYITVSVPKIDLDKTLTIRLTKERQSSFNSRKKQLIEWIINYINGAILNSKGKDWNYSIIAYSLWEEMLDGCYSNQKYRDKTQYGLRYDLTTFDNNNYSSVSSEHDTIYETPDEIIIIDAKMYLKTKNLAETGVLEKQFGYYIAAKQKNPNKRIYNILIKPYIEAENEKLGYHAVVDHPLRTMDKEKFFDDYIMVYTVEFKKILDAYYENKKLGPELLKEIKNIKIDFEKDTIK